MALFGAPVYYPPPSPMNGLHGTGPGKWYSHWEGATHIIMSPLAFDAATRRVDSTSAMLLIRPFHGALPPNAKLPTEIISSAPGQRQ